MLVSGGDIKLLDFVQKDRCCSGRLNLDKILHKVDSLYH